MHPARLVRRSSTLLFRFAKINRSFCSRASFSAHLQTRCATWACCPTPTAPRVRCCVLPSTASLSSKAHISLPFPFSRLVRGGVLPRCRRVPIAEGLLAVHGRVRKVGCELLRFPSPLLRRRRPAHHPHRRLRHALPAGALHGRRRGHQLLRARRLSSVDGARRCGRNRHRRSLLGHWRRRGVNFHRRRGVRGIAATGVVQPAAASELAASATAQPVVVAAA